MTLEARQLALKIPAVTDVADESLIPIFHRWIQERRIEDQLLIDVVDYRHVPEGPGVMLIAHEGHYGFDRGRGGPGLRYADKRDPAGPLGDKLHAALRRLLRACAALESEPGLGARFDAARLSVEVCDRLVGIDSPGLADALAAPLEAIYGEVTIEPESDVRRPAGAAIIAAKPAPISDLLARLS
jgi:hypothetical protein